MNKRFIAGAVCPACSLIDKLVAYEQDETQHRECVRCGYHDTLDDKGRIEEVVTRVNQVRPGEPVLAFEEQVQVLELEPKH